LYESDRHLAPGSIRRVRVIEGVPAAAPPGRSAPLSAPAFTRRVLGEAPVETDGSLQLLVPADVPLEIQALDADGMALAACHWIWVKQKENRGCIGCHENPELVPQNLYALAVQRPPTQLTPPPVQRRSVGFREQVLPVLQNRCAAADCHAGKHEPLLGALHQPMAEKAARGIYTGLLAREESESAWKAGRRSSSQSPPGEVAGHAPGKYMDPGRARTSFLIWEVSGRDQSQPWDVAEGQRHVHREIRKMPPAGQGLSLTDEEFRLLAEWIDLGAPWEAPPVADAAVVNKASKRVPSAPTEEGGM